MKKIIITIISAIITQSVIAQQESLTQQVLWSPEMLAFIDSMGVSESDFYANNDDSHLVGSFPLVFGKNGKYYFQKFADSKHERTTFSSNVRGEISNFQEYYENYIKGFESDSMKTKVYTDDLGILRETYTFYKDEKTIRIIRISFLEGKELWNFRDVTVSPKRILGIE